MSLCTWSIIKWACFIHILYSYFRNLKLPEGRLVLNLFVILSLPETSRCEFEDPKKRSMRCLGLFPYDCVVVIATERQNCSEWLHFQRAPNLDGMVFGCFTQNLRKTLDLDGWGQRKNGFLMFPAWPFFLLNRHPLFSLSFSPPSGVIFGTEECEEVALGGRWGWFFSGTPPHMAWRRRIGLRNW